MPKPSPQQEISGQSGHSDCVGIEAGHSGELGSPQHVDHGAVEAQQCSGGAPVLDSGDDSISVPILQPGGYGAMELALLSVQRPRPLDMGILGDPTENAAPVISGTLYQKRNPRQLSAHGCWKLFYLQGGFKENERWLQAWTAYLFLAQRLA